MSSRPSASSVLGYIACLSTVCALILSLLAGGLGPRYESAKILDRSQQMLMAAQLYHRDGYFQLFDMNKQAYIPAHYVEGKLLPGKADARAEEVFALYKKSVKSFLVDEQGNKYSFKELGIQEKDYLKENEKKGYAHLPYKLLYEILDGEGKTQAYVFPVSGFGLWGPIYGYLALSTDANSVLGISWYSHIETPGLGANISEAWWQDLFTEKQIFLSAKDGSINYRRAPMGISVIKGKVKDRYENSPQEQVSVDGISGATLTGNGVTQAYKRSLTPYRSFLVALHEQGNSR